MSARPRLLLRPQDPRVGAGDQEPEAAASDPSVSFNSAATPRPVLLPPSGRSPTCSSPSRLCAWQRAAKVRAAKVRAAGRALLS